MGSHDSNNRNNYKEVSHKPYNHNVFHGEADKFYHFDKGERTMLLRSLPLTLHKTSHLSPFPNFSQWVNGAFQEECNL